MMRRPCSCQCSSGASAGISAHSDLPPPAQVASIVEEYFSSGDLGDVADSLEDMGMPVSGLAVGRCPCTSTTRGSLGQELRNAGDQQGLLESVSLDPPPVPRLLQGFMHYFVKRLLTAALDRNNREREMASVALSSLYANVGCSCPRPVGVGGLVWLQGMEVEGRWRRGGVKGA